MHVLRRCWIHALLSGAIVFAAAPAAAQDDDIEVLPPIEIRAPRLEGGAADAPAARSSAALRRELRAFDVPAAVTVLEGTDLTTRRLVRSLPDALLRLPGVLVQKTAPMQASPFIRGFTGYNNLLLIDGVRLNHAAFRAGPNQYWSTVDPYLIERLDLVRGPHSALYGSDAVGGTVNAVTRRRRRFDPGVHTGGRLYGRVASAEDMVGGRIELEGNAGPLGWLGGVTARSFGGIRSGAGPLPQTGGIEEFSADLRIDRMLRGGWTFALAGQHVDQRDVPRTEQTIFSVPFAGTRVGSELRRDHDQKRSLVYGRLAYDGGGLVERGSVTLSWHRHEEERDRLRSGGRRDLQGFTLDQFGVGVQMESRTRIGHLTYGVEWYHDEVSSFRRDFVGGVPGAPNIQGAVGDDARYDLAGIYVEDHVRWGRFELFAGARFNYVRAEADRVDNPAVAGSDPTTAGNIIGVRNDWTRLVGSLRGLYKLRRDTHLYAGVSQGFRAPSLHDLTSLESTSVVETPAPGLEPEDYVAGEFGVKVAHRRFSADAAVWYTRIEDAIIRSPTGTLIGGVPEVRKDNIGDGHAWGLEGSAAFRLDRCFTVFGNASWMDAEVKELDPMSGALVNSPLSRQHPFASLLGLRFEPEGGRGWIQAEWVYSDKADRLSLRDKTDTRRIPPGGTPASHVLHLRGGMRIGRRSSLTLAIENLLDENYRIHGSGQNEPGRNVVVGLLLDW